MSKKGSHDFGELLLKAADHAVEGIEKRLKKLWPDDYPDGQTTAGEPAVFDVFEHVVQFEIRCRLHEDDGDLPSDSAYVTWECRLSEDLPREKLGLVAAADRAAAETGHDRTAIEIKWAWSRPGGLDGAGVDLLKLARADARPARYLVLVTDDVEVTEDALRSTIRGFSPNRWGAKPDDMDDLARAVKTVSESKIEVTATRKTKAGKVVLVRLEVPDA